MGFGEALLAWFMAPKSLMRRACPVSTMLRTLTSAARRTSLLLPGGFIR